MKQWMVLLTATMFTAGGAQAGNAAAGNLNNPYFMNNGVLLIPTDGTRSGVPACATESLRFAIDASTPAGKVQAAGILTAFSMGKKVVIWGTGGCTVWGDTETVNFLQVLN
jgi:hypothetical protein